MGTRLANTKRIDCLRDENGAKRALKRLAAELRTADLADLLAEATASGVARDLKSLWKISVIRCGFGCHVRMDIRSVAVVCLLVVGCAAAATFPADLAALNAIAAVNPSFNSSGSWVGDPCNGSWQGVSCDLFRVTSLALSNKALSGPIPPELGDLTGLTFLRLSNNALSGAIPPELGRLTDLETLSLGNNKLSGMIPPELGGLKKLTFLGMGNNGVSGVIPPELGDLTNLTTLRLGDNALSGRIPPELAGLKSLKTLRLCNNALTGEIPEGATEWPVRTELTRNFLIGRLPGFVLDKDFSLGLNCFNMSTFNYYEPGQRAPGTCSDYYPAKYYPQFQCFCPAPSTVGIDGHCYCVSPLQFVAVFTCNDTLSIGNFSANLLDTVLQLAAALGVNSRQVAPLNFSEDGNRTVTLLLNILPSSGAAFSSVDRDAIVDQASVISVARVVTVPNFEPGPISLNFSSQSQPPTPLPRKRNSAVIIGVATVGGVFVVMSVLALATWLRLRQRTSPTSLTIEDTTVKKWKLAELLIATNSFDEARRIGAGGFATVYKATFKDATLAVKRLSNRSVEARGYDDFIKEIKTIGNIHNRNLLGLRGYCIEGEECLLIYDYMANGSLQDRLFGDASLDPLDWSQRVNILVGTANGLAYLHEGCKEKIIHRDIKPANILLDKHFVPHVADFGLVRSALIADTHVSTRVAGTFGYVAPEYAKTGQLTEKSDVFSFGILILVVIGHRPAIDTSGKDQFVGILDWAYTAAAEDRLLDLVASHLADTYDEKQARKLISISLLCTQPAWQERPPMGHVVHMLSGNIVIPTIDFGALGALVEQRVTRAPSSTWSTSQGASSRTSGEL